jgi:hypothetical protein
MSAELHPLPPVATAEVHSQGRFQVVQICTPFLDNLTKTGDIYSVLGGSTAPKTCGGRA